MADGEFGFARLEHWAEFFEIKRIQVVQAAVNGQIGLYFLLRDCFTSSLPNPNPGRPLEMSRWRSIYLQADKPTLQRVLNSGEASNVQEAYISNAGRVHTGWPEAGRVYVELPANGRMATPITIRLGDLFAIGDHVERLRLATVTPPTGKIAAVEAGSGYVNTQVDADPTPTLRREPLPRSQAQDEAILCAIAQRGHDPKAIPPWKPSMPGLKAEMRAEMRSRKKLFTSDKVFDKAWERLRASGDIADA
ncbi:hypothetical protein [Ottowia sp. VDI28]|uniref:hypothetical protein n=1 Tax=Ottowia sp. VDI28 TaxID=3133968 RepID=UPI003C2BDC62